MKITIVFFSVCLIFIAQHSLAAQEVESPSSSLIDEVVEKTNQLNSPQQENLLELKKQRFDDLQKQMEQLTERWMEMKRGKSSSTNSTHPGKVKVPLALPSSGEASVETKTEPESESETSTKPSPVHSATMPDREGQQEPGGTNSRVPSMAKDLNDQPIDDPLQTEAELPPATNLETIGDSQKSDGPIDRFALSSSLFATGHYDECLRVLSAIEKTDWSRHESHWADFLRAGCYRKLGQLEVAQQLYRRLVSDEESEWIGTVSGWWLDQIQEQIEIDRKIQAISVALEQWEREVNDLTK
ncbi:hypothetical protein [Thalassoglobus sp.]|uniref:hypothetical protein n=1 Tax=Thalassoglobus sp. TaxID=2795869 RepID=UPI003AA7DC00